MAETMTPRQRMLAAINNQKADRVPVSPDISNMVPVRLSGKGYDGVFIDEDPPLWKAYTDAVKYFGMEGWSTFGALDFTTKDVTRSEKWVLWTDERKIKEVVYQTPEGELTEQILFLPHEPPMYYRKMVVDLDRDWPRMRYILGEIAQVDGRCLKAQNAEMGESGVVSCCLVVPGFHFWNNWFEGGVMTLCSLLTQRPEILDELRELHERRVLEELRYTLRTRPDLILTGGSGSITLASPDLWMKYAFPTLKELCRICKENGTPTMVHACGKEKFIVDVCARETDLNCINPLEIAPMGDCDLAEVKQLVKGHGLSLMGNLHTTEVMLRGSVETVKQAARKAIEDAGLDGGFILSTGDQCGWHTPDENIFAMIEVAKEYTY